MPSDRRSQLRHRVHTPAYASVAGSSGGLILDASQQGILLQSISQIQAGRQVDLRLDLVETRSSFSARAKVVWSDRRGRAGMEFADLTAESRRQMQEWLFCNALAGQAQVPPPIPAGADRQTLSGGIGTASASDTAPAPVSAAPIQTAVTARLDYAGHPDDEFSLARVVAQAQQLTRADGAAIALSDGDSLVCQATAGDIAPPLGSRIEADSGLSGACVRLARLLACNDAATDDRVDRETCRGLGIRSLVAVPVVTPHGVAGILEVFSRQPDAFEESQHQALQEITQSIVQALVPQKAPDREQESVDIQSSERLNPDEVQASPETETQSVPDAVDGPELNLGTAPEFASDANPRVRGAVLGSVGALLLAALWFGFGTSAHSFQGGKPTSPQNVASQRTISPNEAGSASGGINSLDSYQTEKVQQLRKQAEAGDVEAEFELGAHYSSGDEVHQDYGEAAKWFSKAAEQGHILGAAALGAFYWAGRGVPQDYEKAYVWSAIAKAGGDEASKYRVSILSSRMSAMQVADAERKAHLWLQAHPRQISMHKSEPLQPE